MKQLYIFLAGSAIASSAFAQTAASAADVAKPVSVAEVSIGGSCSPNGMIATSASGPAFCTNGAWRATDTNPNYCYYDGKPYSIGAKRGEQVCAQDGIQAYVAPAGGGVAVKQVDPPRWEPVHKRPQMKAG
ncbi:hypothetical protein [Burkholderia stagnalis]|uniref:hypothetical protein n=1 Tax=Burkholderia stagnalis TaxID=1503054 RepID=UPI000F583DD2|nr:hypothetical protein [Burkholderia stagnalis]RQR11343.1 hypothetical protein DF025_17425 [Burkholderia stagnalis]RQR20373.1 hypothetical protein DF026_17235 [Burkholderia stagnalis]